MKFSSTLRLATAALFLTLLLHGSAFCQNAPTIISPKSGAVLLRGLITFEWDSVSNAVSYHFQVSDTVSFSTTLFSNSAISTPSYSTPALPQNKQLYWRVRAFNGVSYSNWSEVYELYLLNPHSLGNMQLWVRGDSGAIGGVSVSQWQDYSGNNVQLLQADANNRPTTSTAPLLNNAPVLSFDGVNDYLAGGQALNLGTNDQTILIVFNSTVTGTAVQSRLIQKRGHTTNTDGWALAPRSNEWNSSVIESGSNSVTFQQFFAEPPIYAVNDGNYRIVSTVWKNAIGDWHLYTNGRHYIKATETGVMDGADIQQNGKILTIGCSWNSPTDLRFFHKGNIAEIMVYHTALDSASRRLAEEYLRYKYAPPVNLGRNVEIGSGFCQQTVLNAGSYFSSYHWSTGATTASIPVNSPGLYWVYVTDTFGNSSYDEVEVTGGIPDFIPNDTIVICIGDTVVWDTQLNNNDYNFLWHNGSTNSSFTITQPGIHWVEITDTSGCAYRDSLLVIDNQCHLCTASFTHTNELNTFIFQNNSTGNDLSSLWTFGDGATSKNWGAVHDYQSGSYSVCLTVAHDRASIFTGSINGSTLTVTSLDSGALAFNHFISGRGVAVGTAITAQVTPLFPGETLGGIGRYVVNTSQNVIETLMASSAICANTSCQTVYVGCPVTVVQQYECTTDTALLNLPDTCLAVNPATAVASYTLPPFTYFSGISPVYNNHISILNGSCREITNVRLEVTFFDYYPFPIDVALFLRNQYMGAIATPRGQIEILPPPTLLANWEDDGGWYSTWTFSSDAWNGATSGSTDWYVQAVNHGIDTDNLVSYKIIVSYNWGDVADTSSIDTLTAASGCDSIVIVQTNHLHHSIDSAQAIICDGDSLFLAGDFQKMPGFYTDSFVSANGCDSVLITDLVVLPADSCCNASFYTGNNDTVFQFFNTSLGDSLTYFWDFGDSATSTLEDPVHVFDPGTYSVCLTIAGASACADTECATIIVPDLVPCNSAFSYTSSGNIYTFNNVSTGSSLSYLWLFGDGASSALQHPVHPYPSGSYNVCLIISNALGCSDTSCAIITVVAPDEVWPGDANADGIANNLDVLAIGIGYGISGFTRPNATTNWVGQPAPDWQLQLAGGANLKHVDCDGNALIDSFDVPVVSLNYGLTHSKGGDPLPRANSNLYFEFAKDSLNAGDTATGSVYLGTLLDPVTNVYGIAFSLTYDQNIVDSGSLRLDFVNSWMAPDGNRISLSKDFYLASKIDAAVSRIDHSNISGAGKIADVSFVIQDNIDGKDFLVLPLEIQFENVFAIDKDENPVSITANGDTVYVKDEILGISHATGQHGVNIYPNPSTDEVYIVANFTITEYRILDLAGREVIHKQTAFNSGKEPLKIDVSALATGSYFIHLMENEKATVFKKIVVLR